MKDKPLITIAIPTYNRADSYLKKSLQCAISQTYKNIEIIVSDNCSTDNTEELVNSYKDFRIQYFKQSVNMGALKNKDFCLEKTNGVYHLLLMDDDMIDNDFIEACMQAADYSTNFGIIRTGARVINSNDEIIYETPNKVKGFSTEEFFRGWFAGKTSWYPCNTLFNTKGLKKIGGFRSKLNLVDDGMAIIRLAHMYGRADVEDVKASFRVHPAQITFAANVMDWCDDYLYLLDKMCDIVNDNGKLRTEGMRFFCILNYKRTRAINSNLRRFITYLKVYRKFKYVYSPISYLGLPYFKRAKNKLRYIINDF